MRRYFGIALVFLCITVIFISGCTSQQEIPEVTPSPDPTTSIPTTAVTQVITTTIPKINATVVPVKPVVTVKTPSPKPDATDVSEIKFSRYSDSDFSVDYPSAWIITNSTYTPYYCRNNLDPESVVYLVCYKNETKAIGPFNYYDDSNFKKQRRIVTFTSADGKLKFVSFTSDFYDNLNGNAMINPTLDWCRAQFEYNYPDLTGYVSKYLGNYKFLASGNSMTSTYDVTMTNGVAYYPAAYTKRSVVTMHHLYSFGFVTDIENFNKYQNLKEYMLSSITINNAA